VEALAEFELEAAELGVAAKNSIRLVAHLQSCQLILQRGDRLGVAPLSGDELTEDGVRRWLRPGAVSVKACDKAAHRQSGPAKNMLAPATPYSLMPASRRGFKNS